MYSEKELNKLSGLFVAILVTVILAVVF